MDSPGTKRTKLLPANAYTSLGAGEEYQPIVAAGDRRAEVTRWSVVTGLIMVVIFSAACIYMALRAGQAIEAAIPIAILAIFFGKARVVRSTILENVIVQSIGQASGVVAAGAAFLIPALYINRLEVSWWQIFLSCFVGGSLGVALIIPLRKYFVKEQHGELPFPEATAINEILVSGEQAGGSGGKILFIAFGIGAAYDFLVEAVSAWNPTVTSQVLLGGFGESMSALRLDLSIAALASLFGLGLIIGLRYTAVIAAGSLLSYLVLIPIVFLFGSKIPSFSFAGVSHQIANMGSDQIFRFFVRPIGIGAIAGAGAIGILRMGKIVIGSVSLGFKGFKGGMHVVEEPRTQTDMHPRNVLMIQIGSALLMALLFFGIALTTKDSATGATYGAGQAFLFALVGSVVGFILSFLFTPVAAQAIATVGTNPVSGMTLITVVFTILALVAFGLKGSGGMFIALIVGCAVCTALSTSGALITDFKIGYWIGATPRAQQVWKFLGIALSSLVVAFVIPIMDSGYHFLVTDPATGALVSNTKVLPAPQANMIAAVTQGLLADPGNQPWLLYGIGAIVAVILYMAGVPMLAFALGMYLPLPINLAMLAGAFSGWIYGKTGGSERVRNARREQATLIASGLMAGAAIFGIITAILRQVALGAPIRFISIGQRFWVETSATGAGFLQSEEIPWYAGARGQILSAIMYVGLALLCFVVAKVGAKWALAEEDAAELREKSGNAG